MSKRTPLLAVDLEIQMREALYGGLDGLSVQKDLVPRPDPKTLLFEAAWKSAPQIWPECSQEDSDHLRDLAADLPELLTREPVVFLQYPFFDYQLLPCTPLLLLHANVVELAIEYGRSDMRRLPRLEALPGEARRLYGAMRKKYVLQGYHSFRSIGPLDALKMMGLPQEQKLFKRAHAVLKSLVEANLVEPCGINYQLTLAECYHLLTRYHLETKCLPLYRKTYECVWQAGAACEGGDTP